MAFVYDPAIALINFIFRLQEATRFNEQLVENLEKGNRGVLVQHITLPTGQVVRSIVPSSMGVNLRFPWSGSSCNKRMDLKSEQYLSIKGQVVIKCSDISTYRKDDGQIHITKEMYLNDTSAKKTLKAYKGETYKPEKEIEFTSGDGDDVKVFFKIKLTEFIDMVKSVLKYTDIPNVIVYKAMTGDENVFKEYAVHIAKEIKNKKYASDKEKSIDITYDGGDKQSKTLEQWLTVLDKLLKSTVTKTKYDEKEYTNEKLFTKLTGDVETFEKLSTEILK